MPGIGIWLGSGTDSLEDAPIFEDDMKVSKYTIGFAALSAAALTNNITLVTLPAGEVIWGVKIKHSTAFSGGAIATYTVSVGIAGNLAKYASAFDVFQAVGAAIMQVSGANPWSESHTATTAVKIAAVSTGANLDAATAGSVDVWLFTTNAG